MNSSEIVVIIGGTYQRASWLCREELNLPKPNTPRGPIWTDDVRRIRGLRIDRLIDLGADSDLRAYAKTRLKRD